MLKCDMDKYTCDIKLPTLAEKRRLVCAVVRSLLREKGIDPHTVSILDVNKVLDDYIRSFGSRLPPNIYIFDYWNNAPETIREEMYFARTWRDELKKQMHAGE